MTFDGWVGIRMEDVQSVSTTPDTDCLEIRALRARGLWPPVPPTSGIDPDDVVGAVRSMSDTGSLATVFDELDRPDVCWIGSVDWVDEQSLVLREVSSRAKWTSEPRTFMSADVTRSDVGGGYDDALRLVVGP